MSTDTKAMLNSAKSKYNDILDKIPNIVSELNNVKDIINDKNNFNGFDYIKISVDLIDDVIERLNDTKINLKSAISNCNTKIRSLELDDKSQLTTK